MSSWCPANERRRYKVTLSLIGHVFDCFVPAGTIVFHSLSSEMLSRHLSSSAVEVPVQFQNNMTTKSLSCGAISLQRCCVTNIGIPIMKIRRSCLYNGNPYIWKDSLNVEKVLWCHQLTYFIYWTALNLYDDKLYCHKPFLVITSALSSSITLHLFQLWSFIIHRDHSGYAWAEPMRGGVSM